MPAPLPRPRSGGAGGALAHSGRAWSPCSSQPSRQPQEWRQLLGKAAPKPPSTGHSASSAGPSPPLLPLPPPSRGGKEGSPEPSPPRAGVARLSLSSARRFPGALKGLAPSREPGSSSPGEPERPVRLAPAPSVSCPRLLQLLLLPPPPRAHALPHSASFKPGSSCRRIPGRSLAPPGSKFTEALRGVPRLSNSGGVAHSRPGRGQVAGRAQLGSPTRVRWPRSALAPCRAGSGCARWARGSPRCRP